MSDDKQWSEFSEWFDSFNPANLSTKSQMFEAWQAALASQPKPAPVLLTDEEKREILKGAFGIDPAFDGHLMRMAADIESAAHRKNGWGV